jgi:2-polyprenyl-3-methyl-5-hydroxy-6-metoxy-1,4-benzoquinol methylase
MYNLLGAKSKESVMQYLAKNSEKTAKQISKDLGLEYKYIYKILNELVEKEIILKKGLRYKIKTSFIDYINNFMNKLGKTYSKDLYESMKFDLYSLMMHLQKDDKVESEVKAIIDPWIAKRLNDWYTNGYDPKDIEYTTIKHTLNEHSKNPKILEVGCGTGRTSFRLGKDYSDVTAIDMEKINIDFCNKNNNLKSLTFVESDILEFKTKEKYDVILFSWMGLHYYKNHLDILKKAKNMLTEGGILIIIDAYYDTEFIDILQKIRFKNMSNVEFKRSELVRNLRNTFSDIQQKIAHTEYKFGSIEEVINNFRIELTLEESHIWTNENEEKIMKYLRKKDDPLRIGEGFWFTVVR